MDIELPRKLLEKRRKKHNVYWSLCDVTGFNRFWQKECYLNSECNHLISLHSIINLYLSIIASHHLTIKHRWPRVDCSCLLWAFLLQRPFLKHNKTAQQREKWFKWSVQHWANKNNYVLKSEKCKEFISVIKINFFRNKILGYFKRH